MQWRLLLVLAAVVVPGPLRAAARPLDPVDFSGYSPDCGIDIKLAKDRLHVRWPLANPDQAAGLKVAYGVAQLDLRRGQALRLSLGIASNAYAPAVPLLENVEPVYYLTIGTRSAPPGRPPSMSLWNVFFDKPASRPHETYRGQLSCQQVRVRSAGPRAEVILSELSAGPFNGDLLLRFYRGTELIQLEAVVSTLEDRCAILYDAGLFGGNVAGLRLAWLDTAGKLHEQPAHPAADDQSLAVRHRTLVAQGSAGAVACFPPPHQFHFPRDWTNNFHYVWFGRGHLWPKEEFGFGIRQDKAGGGAFVPWFNAPPGTAQRLGMFLLLHPGLAAAALEKVRRYTHGDRFPSLPGYRTMTSHWHMAVAVTAQQLEAAARPGGPLPVPDFVRVFKEMGVEMVHLADFHGDGHPKDAGPLRLPELAALFRECRRLSDDQFLLIPGEEINEFLGLPEPGRHPGHWMSLFPRPVYWIQQRRPEQPLVERDPRYGTVYRVGRREDMVELLRREHGLAWAAHPRIKASSWTPDVFRFEDFYQADFWLGGAWKAMPADLSRARLGERALDLLDDMANWGQQKYLLGEVDVFKIDRTHELYGHMNVNYVQLDRLPRFDDGWQGLLDALRGGKFFVTTGEILLPAFSVGGKGAGETLDLRSNPTPELHVDLRWTFPLRFAEVISGDGRKVYRERIDLGATAAFGQRTLASKPALAGRRWVRFEVWDIAANGAFTQPVWLTPASGEPSRTAR